MLDLRRLNWRIAAMLICVAVVLGVLVTAILAQLLGTADAHALAWSHWWCSSTHVGAAVHGPSAGAPNAALHVATKVLAVHWPHLVPIPLALVTLVYLWRADSRYSSIG